jgi:YD repeat-containing protein
METKTNRHAAVPAIPADATIFKFVAGTAWWATLIALIISTAETVLVLHNAWSTPDPTTRIFQIPQGLFFGLVAELNWRLFRRSLDRVAVSPEGIWRVQRDGTRYLAWRDVANVRANDQQQRLDLIDASGAAAVRVDYQLGNFEALRDFILSHAAQSLRALSQGTGTFHRNAERKIFRGAAGLILLFIASNFYEHNGLHGITVSAAVAGAVIAFVLILVEPMNVVVGHDSFAIHYLGYKRTIAFRSVAKISIRDVRTRRDVEAIVVIERSNGANIRLAQFNEGSVALYEALKSAWKAAGGVEEPSQADLAAQSLASADSPRIADRVQTRPSKVRQAGLAVGIAVFAGAALLATLHRSNRVRTAGERAAAAQMYEMHVGPVAPLSELKGNGSIYLVQMGEHSMPYSVDDFAQWLHTKYGLDVQVLPPMSIDASAWDARRRQYVAEQLYAQLKQRNPALAADWNCYLIGFTEGNMYSTREMWGGTFTERDGLRAAIISADGMGDEGSEPTSSDSQDGVVRFQARLRRILLKDVAILYWHLRPNEDTSSLLHDTLDPDLPVEDIFESDVNPERSPQGEKIDEPCVFFVYSAKDGMRAYPGPLIRSCNSVQDPLEDESAETFGTDLRIGLLIDKHTDLYLPDTIPIAFQRATRDGWKGRNPFGISGADDYDEILGSPDNIHVFVEHDDGARDQLVRVPYALPILPLVKYVGGPSVRSLGTGLLGPSEGNVWEYEMAWHRLPFEHYELRRFNGGVKSYLPCNSPDIYCALVGYTDSQGRELKIERDSNRALTKLISPNGSFVDVASEPDGSIRAIADNKGHTILYGYDAGRRLVSVTYPSGEVYHYEYDDAQHMLSFSISADAHSNAIVLLRNEYENGLLTKQTLANGDTYTYTYDSSDPNAIYRATVNGPRGQSFNLKITYRFSTVREDGSTSTNR